MPMPIPTAVTIEPPKNPSHRVEWVKMQLTLLGSSLSDIARQNGWKPRTVAQALRVPSLPQEEAIARALGLPVERLFAERYDTAGKRLHRILGRKHSRRAAPVHD